MNEEQINLAVNTGLKIFAQGLDMQDVTGAFFLRQLLLLIASGRLQISDIEEKEEPNDGTAS